MTTHRPRAHSRVDTRVVGGTTSRVTFDKPVAGKRGDVIIIDDPWCTPGPIGPDAHPVDYVAASGRWSDPGSDPLADIADFVERMHTNCGYNPGPNMLVMSRRAFRRFATAGMSKRQRRRWRGRKKEAVRFWTARGKVE